MIPHVSNLNLCVLACTKQKLIILAGFIPIHTKLCCTLSQSQIGYSVTLQKFISNLVSYLHEEHVYSPYNRLTTLHVPNATTYSFRSFSCHVFKQRNSLPDNLPTLEKSKFLLNGVFYFNLAISFKY